MKKQILFLISVLSLFFFTGCRFGATDLRVSNKEVESTLTVPKYFKNYSSVYNYIAQNEGLDTSKAGKKDVVFKLAADSELEICRPEGINLPICVVTASYYYYFDNMLGASDEIRGATGNGRYYLLMPAKKNLTANGISDPSFELVGIATGNSYRWANVNNVPQFICGWHISASESPETIYEWDGKIFKSVKIKNQNYK